MTEHTHVSHVRDPFATTWLGIALQLVVVAVLITLTVYVWLHS